MFKIHSDLHNQLQSEAIYSISHVEKGVTPLLGPKILFWGARPIIPKEIPAL